MQVIIKYDNATHIFRKALKNDVLKIKIFLPLDMAVLFNCTQKFSKADETQRPRSKKQRPALKLLSN